MIAPARTLPADLASLVGAAHLRPAGPADAVAGVRPGWVVEPGTPEEAAAVLRLADSAGWRLAPRGGGSKLGWGSPPPALDGILSTARLASVLEHAWGDMTATVQAGCAVATFQRALAEHGQHLALDPLWPEHATLGGILATNDSGALRIRYGTLRDQVIGLTVALPDGTLARSGGKVVKNVAGYDLPKLLTGSFGTLGLITEATFRLYPLPAAVAGLTVTGAVAPLAALLLRVLDSVLVPTGLQLCAGAAGAATLDIRLAGAGAALEAQLSSLRRLVAGTPGVGDQREAPGAVWQARERLWEEAGAAVIAKVSVLPASLAALCQAVAQAAPAAGLAWQAVLQGVGVGLLRLDGRADALERVVAALRRIVEGWGGSLVLLHTPLGAVVEVWGAPGDALPLMRRVKEQFDPRGTLNPGRFVGGI